MSVRTMARVWAQSRQSGTALLMLLAIGDFADDKGNAYPAVATLARKCRVSVRRANQIIARLRDNSELVVRIGAGPNGTNRYVIALGASAAMQPTSALKPTSPLKPISHTPEARYPKPLKPTSDEPSGNHQEPSKKGAQSNRRAKTSLPDGFAVSDAVLQWAMKEGFARHLREHLEYFIGYVRAHGKQYADWDAALQNAIRDDWGGIRKLAGAAGGETAYQRGMRERMNAAVPRIAARPPGLHPHPITFDMETGNAAAIGMG